MIHENKAPCHPRPVRRTHQGAHREALGDISNFPFAARKALHPIGMDRAPQDLGDRECSFSSRRDDHDRIVKTRVLSLCSPESQCALAAAETMRRDSDGTRRSSLFEPRILVSFFFSWSSIQVLTPGQRGLPCPRARPRRRRAPLRSPPPRTRAPRARSGRADNGHLRAALAPSRLLPRP